MERRRALGAVAVVLALGLFAFPLVSQPPDPGPRLGVDAHQVSDDRPAELTTHYANLTPDSQAVFDEAVEAVGALTLDLEDAPPELVEWAEQRHRPSFVVRDERTYSFTVYVEDPPPAGSVVLVRLGSLLGSVVLGAVGGYVLVDEH